MRGKRSKLTSPAKPAVMCRRCRAAVAPVAPRQRPARLFVPPAGPTCGERITAYDGFRLKTTPKLFVNLILIHTWLQPGGAPNGKSHSENRLNGFQVCAQASVTRLKPGVNKTNWV